MTKENKYDINREHRKMNILAKKIVHKHFRQAYIEAKQWNRSIPKRLGGSDGLSPEMIVSNNLGNECHVDLDLGR